MEDEKTIVVDASNLILGRMGARVAKKALLGHKISIINCEESVVTGKRESVLQEYNRKMHMGIPAKGPFFYRRPDMFVKRAIRGMLPYKKDRGERAFKSIKCYIGMPPNFKGQGIQSFDEANILKNPSDRVVDYTKVKDISRFFGWKG